MRKTSQFSETSKSTDGYAASRLASVFADVLGVPLDRIAPELAPDDVERWDSLGHVALVTAVEQEFSIQFEVDEIIEFTTFHAFLAAIERRLEASSRDVIEEGRPGT